MQERGVKWRPVTDPLTKAEADGFLVQVKAMVPNGEAKVEPYRDKDGKETGKYHIVIPQRELTPSEW